MKSNKFFTGIFLVLVLGALGGLFAYNQGTSMPKKKHKRSLADNPPFIDAVREVLKNPNAFASFKRHPILNLLHEYNTFEEGQDYAVILYSRYPEMLKDVDKLRMNDVVGDPRKYNFPFMGEFSPTTLRYAKVAGDIKNLCGSLEGKDVIEIGGGYGGQCKVLSELYSLRSYTIIDVEPSLSLCKKYLEANNIHNVNFVRLDDVKSEMPCDLVVSNFGLSQYDRGIQKFLIQKIVRHARSGYLACGFHPKHYGVKSLPKHELIERLKKHVISLDELPEEPLTAKNNCVLSW